MINDDEKTPVFSDAELKRLKEDLGGLSDGQPFDSEGLYPKETLMTLLDRLEAAEKFINRMGTIHTKSLLRPYWDRWRKEAGKD